MGALGTIRKPLSQSQRGCTWNHTQAVKPEQTWVHLEPYTNRQARANVGALGTIHKPLSQSQCGCNCNHTQTVKPEPTCVHLEPYIRTDGRRSSSHLSFIGGGGGTLKTNMLCMCFKIKFLYNIHTRYCTLV